MCHNRTHGTHRKTGMLIASWDINYSIIVIKIYRSGSSWILKRDLKLISSNYQENFNENNLLIGSRNATIIFASGEIVLITSALVT